MAVSVAVSCEGCGTEFLRRPKPGTKQLFCTPACRQRNYRSRHGYYRVERRWLAEQIAGATDPAAVEAFERTVAFLDLRDRQP